MFSSRFDNYDPTAACVRSWCAFSRVFSCVFSCAHVHVWLQGDNTSLSVLDYAIQDHQQETESAGDDDDDDDDD